MLKKINTNARLSIDKFCYSVQVEVDNHPDNVYFLGNIPDAGRYNSIADLFILPSNYEGLPMVILEVMSAGKPVVASNVGGISEIVVNGENGYVVENTPQAFAEKISCINAVVELSRCRYFSGGLVFRVHLK